MIRSVVPTWGLVYWPWLLIALTLAVLGPEIYALTTNVGNTLSYYAWTELHVRPVVPFDRHTASWLLSQGLFLVMAFWLWRHIWYYQFTG